MSIEDYKQHFAWTTINKVEDNYVFEFCEHEKQQDGDVSKLEVSASGTHFISVTQTAKRQVSKNYNYSPFSARVCIIKFDGENYEYIEGKYERSEEDTNIECHLEPGTYFIWSKVDFNSSVPISSYAVSVYSPGSTGLVKEDQPDLLETTLESSGNRHSIESRLRIWDKSHSFDD